GNAEERGKVEEVDFSPGWRGERNETGLGQLRKIFKTIKAYAAPIWIVNFVEGTRLTSRKLLESQKFARERGLPILRNLLLPRTKGFVACVRQLRNAHVQYVYDFTIAYRHITQGFQFPPNLLQVHSYSPITPPWSFH
ncbi:20753_t:CDS:2, partial [Dentiscutata erythropus]